MSLEFPMNKHLDGQGIAKLINWQINPVPIDPTGDALVESVLFWVEDAKKWKYYDGSILRTFGSEGGRKRGNFNASSGIAPTEEDVTIDAAAPILDGDYFVVTTGGELTGLVGEETLEIGDLLYASIDDPVAASDFFAVQTNIELAQNALESEVFGEVSIDSATPTVLSPSLFGGISSVEIYDINGVRLTDSLAITMSLPDAPPLSGNAAPYIEVVIESLMDLDDLTVILSGW